MNRQRLILNALCFFAAIVAVSLLIPGRQTRAQGPDRSQLFGDWEGESICQVKDSPCKDENVLYHVSKGKHDGVVMISADKIVDGKPVNMGSGDWNYDERTGTLTNETAGRLWKLMVKGKTMEGTLTMPNKTIYRRVKLKRIE